MRSRISLNVAASAFLLLAAGFWWYGLQAARRAELALAARVQAQARLDEGIRQEQDRLAARRRQAAALRPRSGPAPGAAAPNRATGEARLATLLASDPKLRDLYLSYYRANMRQRWGPIYQIAGLTPDQIEKFEAQATIQEGDKWNILAAGVAQGFAPNDPAIAALQQQGVDQYWATEANELGPTVAQQLKQLGPLTNVQSLITDMSSLVATGTPPLTGPQAAQLVQVLADSGPSLQPGSPFDPAAVDWDKASAQAATVLAGPQLEAFKAEAQMYRISALSKQYYSQQSGGK